MSSRKRSRTSKTPPQNPADAHPGPWPRLVILGLAVSGLLSPLITFGGAAAAFAVADKDQGTLLTGAGLVHMVLGLTFLTGA
jgi:hypothetical protein